MINLRPFILAMVATITLGACAVNQQGPPTQASPPPQPVCPNCQPAATFQLQEGGTYYIGSLPASTSQQSASSTTVTKRQVQQTVLTGVATHQLMPAGPPPPTQRINLGLLKDHPAGFPGIAVPRQTDAVPSTQTVYRLMNRECRAVIAKYGDAAVTYNEATQTCSVFRGQIQPPQ